MVKMLLTVLIILLETLSFARSGRDELTQDAYEDKLDNLATESISLQDSLSALQFQPKILDFLQRSIGDPNNHGTLVTLFNKHKHKKVYLGSITGSSSDFYSSYFEDKVIAPESNTTFKVVFLPRHLGETNSSLIIHTSFGVVNYQVRGVGVECQYRLRPLIGIRLPLNATISPEIQLYNPHHFTLQISEIYSSGGTFQLELPDVSNVGQEGDYKLWEIPPYTSKPIIRVRFSANKPGNHTTYVRIKIAGTKLLEEKMLVVPIEIEVLLETGIYSQVPLLDFGMVGLEDGVRHYVYNLLNSGQTSISIKNWGVESDFEQVTNSQCVIVDVVQFSRRNFTDHFTVEVDWSKCSNLPHVVTGNIILVSDDNSYDEVDEITYKVPFFGHIIKGNLSYKSSDLMFLRSDKKSYETSRSIILKNTYNVPLAITNLSVPESCARYFKLTGFKPLILQPGSLMKLLDIQPLSSLQLVNQTSLEETFRIVTNVTYFDIPLKSYTGLLRRIVPVDFARERSQIDERALNFGALLPVSKNSELLIAFVNDNPIPIDIKSWKGVITSGSGQAQISSFQRGCSKMSLEDLVFCNPGVKPGEWVVFAVTVSSPVVGSFEGNFVLRTPFEEINTPVRFSTAMGRLELKSKMIFDECFPGKICSLNIEAYSTFLKKMYVEGIAVDMDGISYEFAVKGPNELPEILPNVDTDVGKLFFNPKEVLCKKRSTCYTSFDALSRPVGETWMRMLTNFTSYILWDQERLRNQLNSFIEVKQSLKQMQFRLTTSQIRRYEFNASINFIWPRLMNNNVEFPFVQVNKMETRFIEIFNPSNQVLFIHFVLHNVSLFGDKPVVLPEALVECPGCALMQENPFSFSSMKDKDIFMDEVKPLSYLKVGIDFFATLPGTYSTILYMRNNLTVVEAVWLSARAVVPQFKFGNRKPGNTTPLQFEINEKHLKLCEKMSSSGVNMLVSSKRTFTAKNYGEVPLMINAMKVENDACVGYGFKVLNCEPFQLMPNESKKIEIAFSPDFTLSRVTRTLNFDTSIGTNVNFTLIGTVASSCLEICGSNMQRPHWEADLKKNALIFFWIALLIVVLASVIDSDRMLKDHIRMLTREKGPIQPPLDLRQIGLEANSSSEPVQCYNTNQERLNKLNNHQTSMNGIRKRLTMTKKNNVSPETSTASRFNLNKPWNDFRNRFTSTKVPPATTPPPEQTTKSSPRPVRHDISKAKTHQENNPKESKKTSIPSEDDSISSSSSKENCEVSSPKSSIKVEQQHESPPLNKNKLVAKKAKAPSNDFAVKDPKTIASSPVTPPVKPLNTNQNQNKNQQVVAVKDIKNKLPSLISATSTIKLNGDIKNHFSSVPSSPEGHQQNDIIFNEVITNGTDCINLAKNEQQQHSQKKHSKTPGRELKALNSAQVSNGIHNLKKGLSKDKQFQYRQNLGLAFGNTAKMNNGHQGNYGPNQTNGNWMPPTTSNIWSSNSSYSDVVAKTPQEPTLVTQNQNYGVKNGMVNGNGNGGQRHHDQDLVRLSNFSRSNDRYVEQEEGSLFGPIGSKKSPSSTPSWESLPAGINHLGHLAKPSPYTNPPFFPQVTQPMYGIREQSRLMNLMSYNDKSANQHQQQQTNHLMEEHYRYQMMQMQERKQQAEWANSAASSNSNNLWSPAYRRESPTQPQSNWSSPSPPLNVPPGFEQQFQQPNVAQTNHQNVATPQVIPSYDPFKSLSAIWEPNRNASNDNDRNDTWNQ